MKHLYLFLFVCCSLSFLSATTTELDTIGDYLSEEECRYADSIFAHYSVLYSVNHDSLSAAIRRKQQAQAAIDYSYQTKFSITRNPVLAHRIGRIMVICDNETYNDLSNKIIRYAKDIHNVYGCAVLVYSLTGGTIHDIKQLIKEDFAPDAPYLSGVVLVGDLPCAYYHTPEYNFGSNHWEKEDFPCDYYLMDLDGEWTPTNDSTFKDHKGNKEPEIFVGRIGAIEHKYRPNRIAYLRNYFNKNHDYWIGKQSVKKMRGLSFTFNDWDMNPTFKYGIQKLYGKDYTDNMKDEQFTKENYINVITDDTYEFIQFACHSYYLSHVIDETTDPWIEIKTSELKPLNIQTLGYNLFCCSACRWDQKVGMCLGETYLYSDNSKTLSLVGSAKTGGMLEGKSTFYKYLGQGDCIGSAYRIWWKDVASKPLIPSRNMRWYYGMCVLGDPLVNFLYDNQCNETLNISSWNQSDPSNVHTYYAQDEITASCVIPENKTLELYANSIHLTNGFRATGNVSLRISAEPCYDNSATSPQRVHSKEEPTTEEVLMDNASLSTELQVYPNPCTSILFISGISDSKIRYKIYDMNGLIVNSGYNDGQNIDVSMLPQGIYTLTVEDSNKVMLLNGFKLIKQ